MMATTSKTSPPAAADELVKLVGAMKTHGGRQSPAPHKPLLVVWATWRRALQPARPRLFPYTEAHAPIVELLTAAGRGRHPRPWYPFVRLGNEPFWEFRGPLTVNNAGDAPSPAALEGVRGGFRAVFDECLANPEVAASVADAVAAVWLPADLAAHINRLARDLASNP